MLFTRKKMGLFLFLQFALSACGGGGDSSNESSTPISVEPVIVNFDVTTTLNTGGSIEPISASVQEGSTTSFTITADDTFEVTNVSGCGGTLTNNIYTTGAVTQACEVSVSFATIETGDGIAPSASILFPGKISMVNSPLVTIRGIAEDADGVKAVRVNGELARLTSISEGKAQSSKTSPSTKASNDVTTKVNWELAIQPSTDQEVIIETEDNFGSVERQAAVIDILNKTEIPSNFTIDHANNRMISQLDNNKFGILDLNTKQMSTFTVDTLNAWGNLSYQESGNQLIFSTISAQNLKVISIALETGLAEVILNIDLALDPSLWLFAQINTTDIVHDENQLYLLLKYFSAVSYDDNKAVAFSLNLDTNELNTVFDGKTLSNESITSDFMAYSAEGLVIFNGPFGEDSLSLVEHDGSDIMPLTTKLGLTSTNINVDHEKSIAYTSGYKGFAMIDLKTGEQEVLSLDTEAEDFTTAQIRSTVIDKQNNRLLVGDSSLDIIMAVDLTTGTRSNFMSNGVGEGRVMVAPREMVLDKVNNRAYVIDDSGNSTQTLFLEIDLATGNRKKITTIKHEYNYPIAGMSIDFEANIIYTTINNELTSVNINDGLTRIVSSSNKGLGTLFNSLQGATLDTVNNRILAYDYTQDSILSIDIDTGDRAIIASSKDDVKVGTGASIAYISALALDEKNQILYAASQFDRNIVKIDLVTNERTVLLTSCNNVNLVDSGLLTLTYNETDNSLLFSNDSPMKYKINDGTCELMEGFQPFFAVAENQKGQIYATSFNSLYQIDMKTNEKVIISK